jgi:flagellar hook-basal body complex protein FliE
MAFLNRFDIVAHPPSAPGVLVRQSGFAKKHNAVETVRKKGEIEPGQVRDLAQAALAIDKAEISMKLMLEVRNKALDAYKEIIRTR